jgi:hypothetical protein
MPDDFEDTSMNLDKYIFVNGTGDEAHQKAINEKARKNYNVVAACPHPDGKQLVVLMKR